ncbi:MAG TPA: tetraacyldisaccharide 4'-kinase [Rhizomicrobium sp.]|nr:tetraacyldisaccharide 4'-kinase [Rhizomicrobium sp.]
MRAPEFWQEKDYTAKLAATLLTPLGWAYGATVAWKAANTRSLRANAKVICVGNLTVGGSGKTPISIAIARALIERKKKTIVLTRGYGGKMRGPSFVEASQDSFEETGDEALLLAAAAPVIVSRDRAAGAKLADAENADVIVMDDGHQNFALEKDLSIVVVDAETGFGNGRIVPAGPLREAVAQGLSRAQAVVLVGDGMPRLGGFNGPVLRARLVPVDAPGVRGQKVVAFAGIGRPQKFFETLRALGAEIAEERAYEDHHAYTAAEFARLRSRAKSLDATLVTTEKDFVRLTPDERREVRFIPVRAAFDDVPALDSLLDTVAPRTP